MRIERYVIAGITAGSASSAQVTVTHYAAEFIGGSCAARHEL